MPMLLAADGGKEPIEVDSVLINPHDLHDCPLAGGAMPRKHGVVDEHESIVRPRSTVGCAAVKARTCGTYPGWH
jgi:hypothetical protein